ncbi:hypothetical protein R3P38DRAFT_3600908 [Favolaschia claudopus]|uniref:Uncharacterized protein n=1 Tax=Favolaschia claudopus TaxID=2862362 RepID=A0AAW0ACM4_9AGAR
MKKNRCGGQKKKKRKERERREKEEEDRDASVSTTSRVPPPSLLPAPLLPPTTPVGLLPTRRPPVTVMTVNTDDSDDDYEPYATFPPPAQWPAHIRDFVYGPRSPAEMLADAVPPARAVAVPIAALVDTPALPRLIPVPAKVAATTARDWSTLQVGCTYPWRTIRRRKRRLRTSCWDALHISAPVVDALTTAPPLPPLLPKHVPVINLLEGRSRKLPLLPAHIFGLPPLHPDDPVHLYDVPTFSLSAPTICVAPDDHLPSEFPAETNFGEVMHLLAYICSRALPSLDRTANLLRDTIWPVLQDCEGNTVADPDERMELLGRMPADKLIFLSVVALMGHLDPTFSPFFDPAIVDYAGAWVDHCMMVGEG